MKNLEAAKLVDKLVAIAKEHGQSHVLLRRRMSEVLISAAEREEADFKEINDIIFAKGLVLGSDDYFKVREICLGHRVDG